jgi:hypothetical protein
MLVSYLVCMILNNKCAYFNQLINWFDCNSCDNEPTCYGCAGIIISVFLNMKVYMYHSRFNLASIILWKIEVTGRDTFRVRREQFLCGSNIANKVSEKQIQWLLNYSYP